MSRHEQAVAAFDVRDCVGYRPPKKSREDLERENLDLRCQNAGLRAGFESLWDAFVPSSVAKPDVLREDID